MPVTSHDADLRRPAPPDRSATRLRRLARSAAYAVVTAAVVTVIAVLVTAGVDPLARADEAGVRAGTDLTRSHGLTEPLLVWQWLTQPWRPYLVGGLVCLWLWLRRGMTTRAWWAFLTMMVAWNVALLAKYAVQRARPVVVDALEHAPGYSFPSGHAANAAAFATAMVIALWPVLSRTGQRVALALATAYVIVTALDRVLLGVHFPSDVTAGVVLGVGLVLASYAGYRGWHPTDDRSH